MTAPARITCIVPVYNEGARVGAVLSVVAGHPLIAEVIVIDDGSSDDTAARVQAIDGVRLIRLPQNRGKTWALSVGIAEMETPFMLLLDGDLLGLTPDAITALARPVLDGNADMSISLRANAPRLWHWIGLDYISGERVLARTLLSEPLSVLRDLPKFGFEVYLNRLCIGRKTRIGVVRWPGVRSPFKNAKYGVWAGLRADVLMMRDIFKTVSPWLLLSQIVQMRKLRVNRR